MSEAGECSTQKRSCRLGWVQAMGPAAERGGLRHVIGIFDRGCRFFPGAVLLKTSPQCLTASQQTVMRIREREGWKKRKRLPAIAAVSATDLDPVVMLIVRLLAATSVANDRIALANRTSPQNNGGALCSTIRFELVQRGR